MKSMGGEMDREDHPGESELARKVKTLLEKEEEVLARGVATTMKNYHETPTTKNLNDWDAAKASYEAFKKKQAAQADPSLRRFKTLNGKDGVLEYLQAEGWKVEKSKLDKDKHKIKKEPDGTYTRKAVDEYARLSLERRDGSSTNITDIAERKARIELENEEIKLWHNRREKEEKEGLWQLKSEVESEFAAFGTFVKNSVGAEFIHRSAENIIRVVEGNPARTPELVELWLREVDEFFDNLSKRKEYTVPVEEEI